MSETQPIHAKTTFPKALKPAQLAHLYPHAENMTQYRSAAFLEWAETIDWTQFPGNVVYLMCISAFDKGRDAVVKALQDNEV